MYLPESVRRAVARPRNVPVTIVRDTDTPLGFRRSLSARDGARIAVRRSIATLDHAQLMTMDQATIDSTGAFLVNELERLDQRLHMPLAAVTWHRDFDLREDVSMADEFSSYTNSQFANAPGVAGSNKAWVGKESDAITGIALDIQKTVTALALWAVQIGWTLPELASAQKLGRPVDQQKYDGMMLKYQMDVDEQCYMGDTPMGFTGALNQTNLTNTGNAVNGTWASATAAQILADINSILQSVWTTSGVALVPNRLLLDPTSYTLLVSTLISSAGNISILEFVLANNISRGSGTPLEIQPTKWLTGTNNSGNGPAATNSMFAYVKDPTRIRYPLVPLQRTPIEYRDLRQLTTYYGRLGGMELVYPETAALRSNLG